MSCGGTWLRLPSGNWPTQSSLPSESPAEEERDICLHTVTNNLNPVISLERFLSFLHLKRVTS